MKFRPSIFTLMVVALLANFSKFSAHAEQIEYSETHECVAQDRGELIPGLAANQSILRAGLFSWSCDDARYAWVREYGAVLEYDRLGSVNSEGECRRRATQCGYRSYSYPAYQFFSWIVRGCIGFN